eukprot:6561508-Prymnesium_polylepis.1
MHSHVTWSTNIRTVRYEDTRKVQANGGGNPANGLNPPPRCEPGCLTYGRYEDTREPTGGGTRNVARLQ